jgi:serine kinase
MDQHQQQNRTRTAAPEKSSGRHGNASPQALSYHRQQQMHLRHIQRIGGLQKLTADLAALQFHDVEPVALNLPQTNRVRQMQLKHSQAKQQQQQQQQPQQQPQQQQQVQRVAADAPEPLEVAKSDSGGSQSTDRVESAVKDTQETAEDASNLRRYKIFHLVGTGNYARVYKGQFLANNKEVAIKTINLSKTSENYRQKFLPRELSILRRINHVNICKIYEISQVGDRIFIVMQYCPRGTIADLLQRNQGPLGESTVRFLFAPTVDAVVYLHSLDIAHRDVKIENILLDHEYTPKLTDFSYSCWLNDQHGSLSPYERNWTTAKSNIGLTGQLKTQSRNSRQIQLSMRLNSTFCGTLPYLSPEMIRQYPYDPKKTDVWSLGICLYVMLNDRLPFPFNDVKLMVKRQLTRDFKFRSSVDVSDACRDLTNQLLDPDFARRITSLEASKHCWMNGPRERPSR